MISRVGARDRRQQRLGAEAELARRPRGPPRARRSSPRWASFSVTSTRAISVLSCPAPRVCVPWCCSVAGAAPGWLVARLGEERAQPAHTLDHVVVAQRVGHPEVPRCPERLPRARPPPWPPRCRSRPARRSSAGGDRRSPCPAARSPTGRRRRRPRARRSARPRCRSAWTRWCAGAGRRPRPSRPPRSRSPETAASAARWETFATLEVSCDWMLVAATTASVGPISQPTPPAGHGVGLGHAVHHQAPVGQLGDEHRHRAVDGRAVDEVLVDLVGDHPQPLLERPAADRLHLGGRVDGAGRVRRRDEEEHLGARGQAPPPAPRCGPGSRRPPSTRDHHRRPPGQGDGLGIGRPVGGGDQHLVAGVAEHGEGVGDRLLPAVGDEHLGRAPRRGPSRGASCPRSPGAARADRPSACSGGSRGRGRRPAAASTMWAGVGKSGSPAPKPMTCSPAACSALAAASTASVADGATAAARAAMRRCIVPAD